MNLYLSPDGYGDPTVWLHNPDRPAHPAAVLSRTDANAAGFDAIAALLPAPVPAWIELWGDGSNYTAFGPDQHTLLADALTPPQEDKADAILNSVDEHQCEADNCAHARPAPIGYHLEGEYDQCHTTGFFLTPDGVALCEDCGVETLEALAGSGQ